MTLTLLCALVLAHLGTDFMRLMPCASRLHRTSLCWFDTTIVAYERPVIETQMLKWTNESVAREERLWNGNVRCSQETSCVMYGFFS